MHSLPAVLLFRQRRQVAALRDPKEPVTIEQIEALLGVHASELAVSELAIPRSTVATPAIVQSAERPSSGKLILKPQIQTTNAPAAALAVSNTVRFVLLLFSNAIFSYYILPYKHAGW